MKITAKQKKRVSSKIVEYLVSRESATRTEVIEGAIRLIGLKPTEMCNLNPKSKYCLLKSYAGTALNDLVIKKVILQNGDKYSLVREEFIVVSQELIQAEIESLLEKGSYSKEEIYIHLEKFFGTDATASSRDDYSLRSIAGNVTKRTNIVYVYAESGIGESTTDAVYAAHNIIAHRGKIIAEALPFAEDNLVVADVRVNDASVEYDLPEVEYDFEGFAATVCCHEYDHLEGILYSELAKEMMTNEEYAQRQEAEKEED
jgi:hypothetical protein